MTLIFLFLTTAVFSDKIQFTVLLKSPTGCLFLFFPNILNAEGNTFHSG